MDNNQLTHWGIKGMKWGVRRYQNADGSLTPEGKRRLAYKEMSFSERRKAKKKYKAQQEALAKAREASKAKREFEAEKKRVIEKGSADDILKLKGKLTADEINKALDRLEADNKASDRLAAAVKKGKSKTESNLTPQKQKAKPKLLAEMSDEEIQAKVNRMNLEKSYRQAIADRQPKGKSFVSKVFEKSGENIATQLVTFGMGSAVNYIAKALGEQSTNKTLKELIGDGNIINPKKGQKDK